MSLNDEERITIVELEMEKAKKIFSEIDLLMNAGLWSNAANRLYYSVYHAVCALLIKDGHKATSHQGNHIGFGAYYVKTGIFPPEYGRFYNQLQTLREQSDYNCVYDVTPEDLNGKIPLAKDLIQRIDDIVSDWLKK
jgi:uncharacterized protein (UPF0332 family)